MITFVSNDNNKSHNGNYNIKPELHILDNKYFHSIFKVKTTTENYLKHRTRGKFLKLSLSIARRQKAVA